MPQNESRAASVRSRVRDNIYVSATWSDRPADYDLESDFRSRFSADFLGRKTSFRACWTVTYRECYSEWVRERDWPKERSLHLGRCRREVFELSLDTFVCRHEVKRGARHERSWTNCLRVASV